MSVCCVPNTNTTSINPSSARTRTPLVLVVPNPLSPTQSHRTPRHRSKYECQFAESYGPYCLVDDNGVPPEGSRRCPSAEGSAELSPRTDLPQLPFFMLAELGYVATDPETGASVVAVGDGAVDGMSTLSTNGTLDAHQFSYAFPTPDEHACQRCCTKMWDEAEWVPADPVVEPPGGGFTAFVSVEIEGNGVYVSWRCLM